MMGCARTGAAGVAALLVVMARLGDASAGPLPVADAVDAARPAIVPVQYYEYPPYGYGRPFVYRRPYVYGPPYGYGPGWRYYNNHFGPGAAKERYTTRRNFCRNQPERC